MSDVWGIDFDQVESRRGGLIPEGRYTFEIDKCQRDLNSNGKPYVGIWAKIIGADDDNQESIGRIFYESRYLSEKAIPYTKGFFEDIGAAHILHPTKTPADAEGTVFDADLVHKVSKAPDGNTREEQQLQNIEPIGSPEEQAEEEPEKEKKPKTSRRRR